MKFFGKELLFNNDRIYHTGDKPTPSEIGAAASNHNHDNAYMKFSGGTMTGAITMANSSAGQLKFKKTDGTAIVGMYVTTGNNLRIGSSTSKAYRCVEIDRLCGTGTSGDKARKVRYGLNDVEGGAAGIELHEDGKLLGSLHFGKDFFRPAPTNTINLGTSNQKWKDGHFGNVVYANSFRATNTAYPGLRFSDNVRIEYDAANDNLYAAGTKTQSGGLRPFQATICDSTVHAKIAGKKVFVQSGTPSGAATGDVWIQV